jgi:hypothetical protein
MDRMKRPKPPAVKCAMEPVASKVDKNDHLQSLVEPRLATKRTEALKQIFKQSARLIQSSGNSTMATATFDTCLVIERR